MSTPFGALARVYDAIVQDTPYDEWIAFALRQARALGYQDGPVLDLACGTGNATIRLKRLGLNVEGLDGSDAMLQVARRKAAALTFHHGDLRDFATGRRYALVTAFFDSLNNLLEDGELEACLARCREHLLPGGVLIFDANTRAGLRDLWEDGRAEGHADGVRYRFTHQYDPESERATVAAEWRDDSGSYREVHVERPYDPLELHAAAVAAGFREVRVVEDPDGAPASATAARVWTVAQR